MLRRHLGLFGVVALAVGGAISSGLFVLPALAYAQAGPLVIACYGLAALLVLPVVFAKAELATALPRSGGGYLLVERSLGPLAGTLMGFAEIFAILLKSAFALAGIGLVVRELTHLPIESAVAATTGVCLTALMVLRPGGTGRFQIGLVAVMLLILTGFVLCAAALGSGAGFQAAGRNPDLHAFLSTTGAVFVAFAGLTKVIAVSEEVAEPRRTIPKGLILAWAAVALIQTACVAAAVAIQGDAMASSRQPLADAARTLGGLPGYAILQCCALLAMVTTANGGLLAASRSVVAMARDDVLPRSLGQVHPRRHTPVAAVLLIGLSATALATFVPLQLLVKAASTLVLLAFIAIEAGSWVLRRSGIRNYYPSFHAPAHSWLPPLAIACYLVLILDMGSGPILIASSLVSFAFLWFLFFVRRRVRRISALKTRGGLHPGARADLEVELKRIGFEREGRPWDALDEAIERAQIHDCTEELELAQALSILTDGLSAELADRAAAQVAQALEARAEVPVVSVCIPGIAPIETELLASILRLRSGLRRIGDEAEPPVGILLLIARPSQLDDVRLEIAALSRSWDRTFAEAWLAASSHDALRDLLHWTRRRR